MADLIYVSKTELSDHLSMQLTTISKAPILESDAATIEMLLSPSTPKAPQPNHCTTHGLYQMVYRGRCRIQSKYLIYALQNRPEGVFRMKGFVRAETRMLSVHVVEAHIDVTTFPNDVETDWLPSGFLRNESAGFK